MSFILRWKAGQHRPCHTPTYCRANFYSTCANGHHSLESHNTLEHFRTWIVRKYRHSTFDTRCHRLWSHSTLDSSGLACVQTPPISFVAGGKGRKGPFSTCNKGNRRRLQAGNIRPNLYWTEVRSEHIWILVSYALVPQHLGLVPGLNCTVPPQHILNDGL